jgi:hypothetical protein
MTDGITETTLRSIGDGPAELQARWDFLRHLQRQQPILVARMLAEIRTRLSSYAGITDELVLAEISEGIARALSILVAHLAEDRSLSSSEHALIRRIGARRAQVGLPLRELLEAAVVCKEVGWRELVEFAVAEGMSEASLKALFHFELRLSRSIDEIRVAMHEGYERHGRRARGQSRAWRLLLQTLLAGDAQGDDELTRDAAALGRSLSAQHAVILVTCTSATRARQAALALTRRVPDCIGLGTAAGADAKNIPVVISPLAPSDWQEVLAIASQIAQQLDAVMITAEPAPGPDGLRGACGRARASAQLVRNRQLEAGLIASESFDLELILSDPEYRRAWSARTLVALGRLPKGEQAVLERTIVAYLGGGGQDAVAKRVHVCRTALAKRLAKVRRLTGLPDGTLTGDIKLFAAFRLGQVSK